MVDGFALPVACDTNPLMTDRDAAGAAAAQYNDAAVRHADAIKRLEKYGRVIKRLTSTTRPMRKWNLSQSEDLRYEGGILCDDDSYGSGGLPITSFMWPTFEQLAASIKDRDESAAARDAAGVRPAVGKGLSPK